MRKLFIIIASVLFISITQGQNVGIGTPTPGAKLEIVGGVKISDSINIGGQMRIMGGTPGAGKVLTSNATGLASWATPATTSIYYPSVTICGQQWMDKNLDVITYSNGDPIPYVTDSTAWLTLTTGAWCYYNNDPSNNGIYGKLYNWYAVNDPRGLAPTGWHVPSDAEWSTLSSCLGGDLISGGKMKVSGTTTWFSPNTGANNTSGFAALPGGDRYYYGNGTFENLGDYGFWWSSTQTATINAKYIYLYSNGNNLNRFDYDKRNGYSVRCLRD